MLSGASSAAIEREVTIAAPLLPLYQVSPGRGRTPAVEAMVMNTPLFLRRKCGTACFAVRKRLFTLTRVDAVELVFGHVEHRLVAVRRAGVVDDDVEIAEAGEREGDEPRHVGVLGHVAGAELGPPAGRDDLARDALAVRRR